MDIIRTAYSKWCRFLFWSKIQNSYKEFDLNMLSFLKVKEGSEEIHHGYHNFYYMLQKFVQIVSTKMYGEANNTKAVLPGSLPRMND